MSIYRFFSSLFERKADRCIYKLTAEQRVFMFAFKGTSEDDKVWMQCIK